MMSDASLLRRYAAEKSEEAFTGLVRRHLSLVYGAALRQVGGDVHRAQEVTQSVFTDLARKAGVLTNRESLAGWLHTSVRYAAAKAMRTEARRIAHEREAEITPELFHHMKPDANWERLRPVIDEAVQALNESDREAVLLRFFERRSFVEVGATLRVGEDAARMRVERALDKLRTWLVRRGVTSTTAALGLLLANEATAAMPTAMAASVAGSAMSGAAGAGGPAAGLSMIFMKTKLTLTAAGMAGLLGVGFYLAGDQRVGATLASESSRQLQALERVRRENRLLQAHNEKMASALAPTGPMTAAAPADRLAGLRALTDLIIEGTVGIDAIQWVNFTSAADIFGLRPEGDDVSTRRSQHLIDMFALTPSEVATLRELGERTKAEIARGAMALSKVHREGDELSIDVRPDPTARTAYDRMVAEFRHTLGEDRFEMARLIGWEASIQKQMDSVGLSAFTFTSVRGDRDDGSPGVVYRGRRFDSRGKRGSYVTNRDDLRTGLGPLSVLIPSDF